jgi:MFS family permease
MTQFWRLSAAGFAATAISFGPARMGFGLFVPEFRSEFSMSTSSVGYVSSLGFVGFFVGLLVAQFLIDRRGPRVPVLAGLTAGCSGWGWWPPHPISSFWPSASSLPRRVPVYHGRPSTMRSTGRSATGIGRRRCRW